MLESAVIWLVIWGLLAFVGAPLVWGLTVLISGGTAALRADGGKQPRARSVIIPLIIGGLGAAALFVVSIINTIIQVVSVVQAATGA